VESASETGYSQETASSWSQSWVGSKGSAFTDTPVSRLRGSEVCSPWWFSEVLRVMGTTPVGRARVSVWEVGGSCPSHDATGTLPRVGSVPLVQVQIVAEVAERLADGRGHVP